MSRPFRMPPPGVTIMAITFLAGLVVPSLTRNGFVLNMLAFALIYALLAASWDLLIGYAGLVSFGHAGFYGFGGYAAAVLTYYLQLPAWFGLPIGALAGALLGVLIGIPTLKLRTVYLALATLAMAESLRIVAMNWYGVTRGSLGFNLHSTLFRLSGQASASYYLILIVVAASIGCIYWIGNHTLFGWTFRAIRDDEMRANALGIDVVRYKVLAFAISGLFAGLAGALYAHTVGLVSPTDLSATTTMLVVAMSTIGGIGTIVGPTLAALLLYVVSELLRMIGATYGQVAIGTMLIIFVVLFPDGIAGALIRFRSKLASKRSA